MQKDKSWNSNKASSESQGSIEGSIPQCTGCAGASIDRRDILKGAVATLIGMSGLVSRSAFADGAERPKAGDRLAFEPEEGEKPVALKLEDISVKDDPVLVYPFDAKTGKLRSADKFNGVIVMRFDPSEIPKTASVAAPKGLLAFSAICTHAGCPVKTFRKEQGTLFCYCHFSEFKPLENGAVAKGPATRGLPVLPLSLEGDTLVVAGSFSSEVGPGHG